MDDEPRRGGISCLVSLLLFWLFVVCLVLVLLAV
jgi:hypothetical protein